MKTERTTIRPVLLCFDCCSSTQASDFLAEAEREFVVARDVGLQRAAESIARFAPRVLACDFDYPDRSQLRLVQSLRRTHPRLPIVMLTVHHTEELAVWALRSRVWNYFVKPVDVVELRHDLAALACIAAGMADDGRHPPYWPAQDLPSGVPAQSRRDRFTVLRPALAYVKRNFQAHVREEEAAQLCGLTRFEFSRAFHKTFGLTYIDYVLKLRIRAAQRMLRTPGARVADVCYAVGFNDPSYFARVFRERLGLPPASWARTETERAPRPAPRSQAEELEITSTVLRLVL